MWARLLLVVQNAGKWSCVWEGNYKNMFCGALVGRALMGRALMGQALMGRALMGRALMGRALMGRALMGRALMAPRSIFFYFYPGLLVQTN